MAANDAYASNSIRAGSEGDASLDVSLDEGWIGALSRLGRLVMALHRLAATAAADDLQRLCFEALHAFFFKQKTAYEILA